jgi:GNAT superfamily N-acetyltransferase
VQVQWLDPRQLDQPAVAGAVAVLEAARRADAPHLPPLTVRAFTGVVTHGWDGDPEQAAVARDGSGRVHAVVQLLLPSWDNRHLGYVDITVDPSVRRQGLGRLMYDATVARVRAEGRTVLMTHGWDLPGSVAFAKAMGLDRAAEEVQRRQELDSLDRDRLDRAYDAASQRAGDYELLRLAGPVPADLRAPLVVLTAAINDAPTDDLELEDEVFSEERLQSFESAQAALGRRIYRVMARDRATGALAGHTVMAVDAELPWYASQYDTSVLRAHRGHRLGMLMKIDMLRWLAAVEPQVREVETWNAASNEHMIAVNEALGYLEVARTIGWQRRL